MLSLARLAASVAPDAPQAEMCAAILALLDQHQAYVAELSFGDGEPRFPGIHLLVVAAGLARTPDVPAGTRLKNTLQAAGRVQLTAIIHVM